MKRPDNPTLDVKEKKFCLEYMKDLNGTQAAMRAGYYAENSDMAKKQAYIMLGRDSVKAELSRLKYELLQFLEAESTITASSVIAELAKIAFSEITDYVVIEDRTVEEILGYEDPDYDEWLDKPFQRTHRVVEVFETAKMNKKAIGAISYIKQGKDGIELKLHDKVKALELIGRYLGMWVDKQEHTVKGAIHLIDQPITFE